MALNAWLTDKVENQLNLKNERLSLCRAELRSVTQPGTGIEKAESAPALPS